jgi:hypothetical protein
LGFARKKLPAWWKVAFAGVLRFRGVLWMVNRGEVVVICVANVAF